MMKDNVLSFTENRVLLSFNVELGVKPQLGPCIFGSHIQLVSPERQQREIVAHHLAPSHANMAGFQIWFCVSLSLW